MNLEVIRSRVGEIPVSELGKIADDHEIWEETDGGAHFKVTRHKLEMLGAGIEFLSLSVSGTDTERERIVQEFTEVLGPPNDLDQSPYSEQPVDIAGWLLED